MTDYVGEEMLSDWLDYRRETEGTDTVDTVDRESTPPVKDPGVWGNPSPDGDDTPLPF